MKKERVARGVVKPWREKHKVGFAQEREVILTKVQRRRDDLVRFEKGEIFPELAEVYGELRQTYADAHFSNASWSDRREILRNVANLIDGDDRKSFLMLYFYNIETTKYTNERIIREFGGSFGWTHYEWMMHWYQGARGMCAQSGEWKFENTRLQRWIEKKRFIFE